MYIFFTQMIKFRDKASAFWNTLQPMAKDFDNIETLQLTDVEVIFKTILSEYFNPLF